jgi:pilus assembly protein CpaE
MAMLTVAVVSADPEQRSLLEGLVNATSSARVVLSDPPGDLSRKLAALKPQVLLLDLMPGNPAPVLAMIEPLRVEFPGMTIFASGDMSNRQLIVEAMRRGAGEFLDRPPSANSLHEAFARLGVTRRRGSEELRGRIITVLNAKGGCGATTVAVNVAVGLNESHGSTVLVDAAPIGHAALHLNARPTFGLVDALQNWHRLDTSLLDGFITKCASGVSLLAGNPIPIPMKPAEEELGRVFDLLVSQYKYVVVDASSRLDSMLRIIGGLSDTVLMVAETDMIALLWNAARVQSFLGEPGGRDKVRLVLNRFRRTPEFSDADAEAATDAKILWKIPSQYFAVGNAIDRGMPVALSKSTEVARSFRGLADALVGEPVRPARSLLHSEAATRIRAFSTLP